MSVCSPDAGARGRSNKPSATTLLKTLERPLEKQVVPCCRSVNYEAGKGLVAPEGRKPRLQYERLPSKVYFAVFNSTRTASVGLSSRFSLECSTDGLTLTVPGAIVDSSDLPSDVVALLCPPLT
jgi:hypothetical protein